MASLAAGLLVDVLTNISSELISAMAQDLFSLSSVVDNNLKSLNGIHRLLEAIIFTAQERRLESKENTVWLEQLQEAAYELDDLIDESYARFSLAKQEPLVVSEVLLFRHKAELAAKTKSALSKLQYIADGKRLLIEYYSTNDNALPQSHSSIPRIFIGRKASKILLLNYLTEKKFADNLATISIVGMGGLGKTTIVQTLYHHDKVKNYFYPLIWVDVSDKFDLRSILAKMVKDLTYEVCDHLEVESLNKRFRQLVNGKRYLLVMDNAWSDDFSIWDDLRDLLNVGNAGSRVIVTTRDASVAKAASRPGYIHLLPEFSQNDSWSLFEALAISDGHVLTDALTAIGKEIVSKCCGVPLAIKAVVPLLYGMTTDDEWRRVKDKMFLSMDTSLGKSVLPILEQSYIHLPHYLKMCFLCCGIFPKGELIMVEKLVSLWAAHGLIQKSNVGENEEDVGLGYARELVRRSLLEIGQSYGHSDEKDENPFQRNVNYPRITMRVKMHDLINELCIYLSKDEVLACNEGDGVSNNTRHVMMPFPGKFDPFTPILEAKNTLRTLIILRYNLGKAETELIFKSFRRLRFLEMAAAEISPAIGNLIHLRFLGLYGVEMLPESITDLWHLQALKLDGSLELRKLPKGLNKMVNLTILSANLSPKLTKIPKGIGKLTKLRELTAFMCNKKSGAALEELCGLNNLSGRLAIRNLYCAGEVDGEKAILQEKIDIEDLLLNWGIGNPADIRTMNVLKPHNDLKIIAVHNYGGAVFSNWFFRLSGLMHISITNCHNLNHLSSLHLLPALKTMYIETTNLEFVEVYDSNIYKNLEYVEIKSCKKMKGWCKEGLVSQFPALSKMRIEDCPLLESLANASAPILDFGGCPKFASTHNNVVRKNYLRILYKLDTKAEGWELSNILFQVKGIKSVSYDMTDMEEHNLESYGVADVDDVVRKLNKSGLRYEIVNIRQCDPEEEDPDM